jgi:hypothetical protein
MQAYTHRHTHLLYVKERIECSADGNAPYSHFMLKPVGDGFIQLKNKVMMHGSLENEPFVAVDFTGMKEYAASTSKK